MDSYQPQGGMHVSAGHEESDFSLRGIILFIVILVLSAILTFFAAWGLMNFFEWWEKTHEAKSTPVQQQLHEERGDFAKKQGLKPPPDWYDREIDAKVIQKTFAAPRLQDDDAGDMRFFLTSEKDRLENTGKDPDGSIHIPIDRAIDLLSDPKRGLPQVNGTFVPGPPLGNLTDVSQAAQRRLSQASAPVQEKKK